MQHEPLISKQDWSCGGSIRA